MKFGQETDVMFDVTEAAQQKIKEFFQGSKARPIRLSLNTAGCGRSALVLGLDEATKDDEVFDVNGFQFVANKELLSEAQPVTIDFRGAVFEITSSIKMPPGGCEGCDSAGTCG